MGNFHRHSSRRSRARTPSFFLGAETAGCCITYGNAPFSLAGLSTVRGDKQTKGAFAAAGGRWQVGAGRLRLPRRRVPPGPRPALARRRVLPRILPGPRAPSPPPHVSPARLSKGSRGPQDPREWIHPGAAAIAAPLDPLHGQPERRLPSATPQTLESLCRPQLSPDPVHRTGTVGPYSPRAGTRRPGRLRVAMVDQGAPESPAAPARPQARFRPPFRSGASVPTTTSPPGPATASSPGRGTRRSLPLPMAAAAEAAQARAGAAGDSAATVSTRPGRPTALPAAGGRGARRREWGGDPEPAAARETLRAQTPLRPTAPEGGGGVAGRRRRRAEGPGPGAAGAGQLRGVPVHASSSPAAAGFTGSPACFPLVPAEFRRSEALNSRQKSAAAVYSTQSAAITPHLPWFLKAVRTADQQRGRFKVGVNE